MTSMDSSSREHVPGPVVSAPDADPNQGNRWRIPGVIAGAALTLVMMPGIAHADGGADTVIGNRSGGPLTFCEGDGGAFGGGPGTCREPSVVGAGDSITVPHGGTISVKLAPRVKLEGPGETTVASNCRGSTAGVKRVSTGGAVGIVGLSPGGGFNESRYLDVSTVSCRAASAPAWGWWHVNPPKKTPAAPKRTTRSGNDGCLPGLPGDICRGAHGEAPTTSKPRRAAPKEPNPGSFWENLGRNLRQSPEDKARGRERRRAMGAIGLGTL